jgi:hypothetical protein
VNGLEHTTRRRHGGIGEAWTGFGHVFGEAPRTPATVQDVAAGEAVRRRGTQQQGSALLCEQWKLNDDGVQQQRDSRACAQSSSGGRAQSRARKERRARAGRGRRLSVHFIGEGEGR